VIEITIIIKLKYLKGEVTVLLIDQSV